MQGQRFTEAISPPEVGPSDLVMDHSIGGRYQRAASPFLR
jgi:hypothetical protein